MVRDFLSGIAMLMEDQYGPGDVVDAGPAKGVVERVGHQVAQDEQWQPFLLEAPELWGVEEVKPASVTIRLAVKTRPSKRDDVARQLRAGVEGALEQAGIPLPPVAEGVLVAPSPDSSSG
jgi:small-conductance mechanosensitive channel